MKSYIEHVAICVKDIHWSESFFKEALGLEEVRRAHHEDGSIRSIWFRNGLQLLADGDKTPHHLGLVVDDFAAARKAMLSFTGVKQIEGRTEQWLELPDGTTIELFQANPNAIDEILKINIK